MSVTDALVRFSGALEYEAIPGSVIEVQKKALIDGLSVMVAATHLEPACRYFVRYAKQYSGPGQSTLLGAEARVSAPMAALANGALSHAMDFEDSHDTAFVHSNAVSIPALLAVAEEAGGISGKEFLTALVLASEVTCRLSAAQEEDLLQYGWYMPPVHGSLGTTFALCRMLRLSREQTLDALALDMNSYTCSGESVNSRASVIRLVRDGLAAQAAVEASLLAREGVQARFEKPLEGNKGYYAAYARGRYKPEPLTGGLGSRWESGQISFKPWPCCRATHVTIGLLQELLQGHQIQREEIREIHLRVSQVLRMVLEEREIKYHPQSVMNAKMSIPFAVGLVLTDGDVTLDSFRPERLQDPQVIQGGELVTYEIDPALEREHAQRVEMEIRLKDGRVIRGTGEHALGSVERPMTREGCYRKYESCMRHSRKEKVVRNMDTIFEKLLSLEDCRDIRELADML